ncbi:hypothetical protein CBF16_14480 [Pantoea agglomerans]|uniref:hypothetical protein n=1 Tax=Enterobacter agglomerans TaxID=549 RepID=UPI000F604064|nr:hypothetical protein [Pantoea agglomerans]AZI51999.1 hypothetical protein CBF16_14480 [Pantoea agglomerans]
MTLLLKNWRTALALLLVVLIAGLLLTAAHYRDTTLSVEKERDAAVQQQKSAEAITANVFAAVRLFNDIAASTQRDQQQASASSENRIVIIRQAVESDKCAALPVPAAAAQQLRQHRNQISAGTTGTHSGQPDR